MHYNRRYGKKQKSDKSHIKAAEIFGLVPNDTGKRNQLEVNVRILKEAEVTEAFKKKFDKMKLL